MRLTILLAVLFATACGAGEGPSDGGPRADRPRPPLISPDAPAPPVIAPCPEGWREVEGPEALTVCEPWPDGGRETCPDGQAHFPGAPGCAQVGAVCPADGWPADLPTDRPIRYVALGAPAGGDGMTQAMPFATIGAALAAAPEDAVIAIASGRYDEVLTVNSGRTLWGACASGTEITSSMAADNATVVGLIGEGTGLRNLSVDAPERNAIAITASGTTIDGVIVNSARVVGISVTFGSLRARELLVRSTEPDTSGNFGNGMSIAAGTSVVLERAVFAENRNAAIALSGPGAALDARAIAIEDTAGQESDDRFGHGIAALGGATAVIEESVLEGNHTQAIYADGNNSRVTVRRSVIRGTLAQASDMGLGRGGDAIRSATIVLVRTLLEGNTMGGLFASSGELALTDVIVAGTLPQANDRRFGYGLFAEDQSTLSVLRVLFSGNHTGGVILSGSSMTGEDLRVSETSAQMSEDNFGRGVHVAAGGLFEVTRVAIASSREAALSVVGTGTIANLGHLTITGVAGPGISIEGGALRLDIARVEDTGTFGAGARGGGSIAATELALIATGDFGLVAQEAEIGVEGFEIRDTAECAYLLGPGADVDLTRGDVTSTNTGACLQLEDYDVDRLHDDVVYVDTAAQRQTTHVLPAALPAFYE
jgi:hypothetical protein